jgi:DNA-binding NarL/FixJ family response regulator
LNPSSPTSSNAIALPPAGAIEHLTPEEYEVCRLAAEGYTTPEIAERRQRALSTVDKQLNAGLKKLGIHRRTVLARWWALTQTAEPKPHDANLSRTATHGRDPPQSDA